MPVESRPRGDRPVTGQAVPRGSVPGTGGRPYDLPYYGGYYGGYYYPGYYGSYYGGLYNSSYGCYPGYWGCDWGLGWGWGYGLGSLYYSPYMGWGGGLGYAGYEWGYPGYASGYPAAGSGSPWYYTGSLKLKVRPRNAEVYVDGYYVGVVDDFDGVFQELTLSADPNAGVPHRIEIRAPGAESIVFEVRLQPGQVITYRGDLVPGVQPIR